MKKPKIKLSDRVTFVFLLFSLSATLMFVVTLVVSVYISRMETAVQESTHHHLLAAAQAASTFLTVEELDLFHTAEDMERPEWEEIKERLMQFAEDYRVLYVYYWRYHEEEGTIQYIIDNDEDEEWMVTPEWVYHLDEDPATAEAVPIIVGGSAWASNLGDYTASWDGLISGLAPVFNDDGTVYSAAGVDLSDEIIINQRNNIRVMRSVLFASLFLSILSGLLGMWLYRRKAVQSENNSLAKSQFLSVMSHEIRTPMNAITGMSELLLRKDLPDDARTDVQDIKQASSNLLAIINDILDFSKIEAGKLEIIPVNYLFSSLVNDTVNIIRMRLIDKPIRFFTNIDSRIPNSLFGDESRMRQVIINLLSNAAKFTEKGHISMTITMDKHLSKLVWLRIVVADTGIGIKPEDQAKLFGDFAQVDTHRNRSIEGTGLGLSITKKLCLAMGGDISVVSEYGKGSQFSITIPQDVSNEEPFAAVEDNTNKNVLIYEGRNIYAQSVSWSLDNMGVPHQTVHNEEEFEEALKNKDWYYIFSGYGLYNKIKPIMEKTVFSSGNTPPLALMVEWGTEAYIPNVRFVSLPTQSLSISNTLNGVMDGQDYFDSTAAEKMIRFNIPNAKLLLVDDIAVNLKVAEGLLAPYKAVLDTCLSGSEAIELVKRNDYDIVFMDHMMPEMDGIEATALIRSWEKENSRKTVPIIALTANAISGMKEMFIQKGFSDFLAKPIDLSKLDEILDRWINKEKRVNSVEVKTQNTVIESGPFSIPGLNIKQGIAMTGGTEAGYKTVLSMFCKDAEDRIPYFQSTPPEEDIIKFVTQVHALKSASASIGASLISEKAEALEAAGKAKNMEFINEKLSEFSASLTELIGNIRSALFSVEDAKNESESDSINITLLDELTNALESGKASEIDDIIDGLMSKSMDAEAKALLDKISDDVLLAEFASAKAKVQELIAKLQ